MRPFYLSPFQIAHFSILTAGGCQVPSMIDGGVSCGQ